jgi:hypothetical protein
MADQKQKQNVIYAQHVSRVDAKGNPARKTFTEKAWANIPNVDYMSSDGRTKQSKGGWFVAGPQTGTEPPAPLKDVKEKAKPGPKPKAAEPVENDTTAADVPTA